MTKFSETYNAYRSEEYVPREYYSPFFYQEMEQERKKNKEEIFDYYGPRALADKLAELEHPEVTITDNGLNHWGMVISTGKMGFSLGSDLRPDVYTVDCHVKIEMYRMNDRYTSLNYKDIEREIASVSQEEIKHIIKDFPINIECIECHANMYSSPISLSSELGLSTRFLVKEIINLDNVKFMEQTIPRVMYDRAKFIVNRLSER